MARTILVVGLSGCAPDTDWELLLGGRTIVARSRGIAERYLPSGWRIDHSFDEVFERAQLAGVEAEIANDIVHLAQTADIAYLTPGPSWAGDATIDALRQMQAPVAIAPNERVVPFPAHLQVIDALLLAQAEERAPFDTGVQPVDPTVPALIFNWHGTRVTALATARLLRVFGMSSLPPVDPFETLVVPAIDPLVGPPSFAALAYITARLRQPDGCPWDREQTHASMLEDFASEVEEYAEAVRTEDWPHAAEELGDVLLNVLMQAQIGVEAGHFRIEDVLESINAKLVRRHPHVFGDVVVASPDDVLAVWNSVKQQEKHVRHPSNG